MRLYEDATRHSVTERFGPVGAPLCYGVFRACWENKKNMRLTKLSLFFLLLCARNKITKLGLFWLFVPGTRVGWRKTRSTRLTN